jgi:hypothetical protein
MKKRQRLVKLKSQQKNTQHKLQKKKLLPNFLKKVFNIIGIDKAVGFGVINRMWSVLAGPLTILLISQYFSKEEQGYYYTFYSLIGLQVFFELGLLTVLAQFSAHEFAYLSWGPKGAVTGSEPHLDRLIDLLGKGFKWYTICAILLVTSLIPAGLLFFIQPTHIETTTLNWQLPWILTVIGVGCNLLLIPFYGIITGSGDIASIQKRELMGAITSSLIGWFVIACGGGLFAIPAVTSGSLIVGTVYLLKSKPHLVKSAFSNAFGTLKSNHTVSWWGDVWPMQWKVALSWISGYFIFQLFTPVLFKYHGPIVAGQMGMTMAIWSAILGICTIWASVKSPVFGKLIATKKWQELDKEFYKILWQSTLISILICSLALIIVYTLQEYTIIGERLLPVKYIAYLFIALIIQVIINNFAVYLRAHKKEPYLLLSIFAGLLQGTCVIVIGRLFSYEGITIGFAAIQTILSLPAFIIWLHCKITWHHPTVFDTSLNYDCK